MVQQVPAPALAWLQSALNQPELPTRIQGLRLGGMPWLVEFGEVRCVLRLNDADDQGRRGIATEAEALAVASGGGVLVPQVVAADPEGVHAGRPALAVTVVEGSSRIPSEATRGRLLALGAQYTAIAVEPTAGLPWRDRPISDVDFGPSWLATPSASLMAETSRRLADAERPDPRSTLLHGDFWNGNCLWRGDEISAVVDWDCAGVGPPEVDLSSARLDVALFFGLDAVDVVLEGWHAAGGRRPDGLAYTDARAALATPGDLLGWLDNMRGQGRPDLTAALLVERRDAFLAQALAAL